MISTTREPSGWKPVASGLVSASAGPKARASSAPSPWSRPLKTRATSSGVRVSGSRVSSKGSSGHAETRSSEASRSTQEAGSSPWKMSPGRTSTSGWV